MDILNDFKLEVIKQLSEQFENLTVKTISLSEDIDLVSQSYPRSIHEEEKLYYLWNKKTHKFIFLTFNQYIGYLRDKQIDSIFED